MKSFERGIQDFKKGRITSPFGQNSNSHKEWTRGFNKAYFDNLERLTKTEANKKEKDGNRKRSREILAG